jgi:hypothetical protein
MANKTEIKNAILKAAGNPDSGVVFANADKWADAIVALDSKTPPTAKDGDDVVQESSPFERAKKEVRVTKPTDIR